MRPAVLKACWDVAVVGDDAPVPVADRDEYRAMLTDPDPSSAARTFGLMSASLVCRVGPLLRVLADAAHEPELADLLAQTRAERLTGTRLLLAKLSGADPDTAQFTHAVDVVYAYVSPELTLVLAEQRGWSSPRTGNGWASRSAHRSAGCPRRRREPARRGRGSACSSFLGHPGGSSRRPADARRYRPRLGWTTCGRAGA